MGLANRGIYIALVVVAGAVNLVGYLLNLWHDETVFDEAVHLYTSFAVVAAIGRLALGSAALPDRLSRWWSLLIIAVLLGLAWEAFEWVIGIIGGGRDTIMDLVMDTVGGAIAAALIHTIRPKFD